MIKPFSKTSALERVLANQRLEFSTRAELRERSRRDFDGFASLRITTGTSFSFRFHESAKTDKFNFVAFFNRFFDGVESAVQELFSLSFGDADFAGDFFDEFRFVHSIFPHMENFVVHEELLKR